MTAIVGLINKGDIYLGGDSSSADADTYHVHRIANPKVFKKRDFVIGYTSSFRMGQILQHCFEPPNNSRSNPMQYMVADFIPCLRKCFNEQWKEDAGGTFLIGYKGKLFSIYDDFQVNESQDGYAAIGCGSELSLGSLYTTNKMNLKPRARVKTALEAAEQFSGYVVSPFNIVCLRSGE